MNKVSEDYLQACRTSTSEALALRDMMLADGYLSRGERKIVRHAIQSDRLDEAACEIFLDLLLRRPSDQNDCRRNT